MSKELSQALKGRAALSNPDNRFETIQRENVDDGWGNLELAPEPLTTTLTPDSARSVISYNQSPDVPFDRSINPYRGCEHGCIYCFARPSHAWLGLSPGLDFETQLYYKANAAQLLSKELDKPSYRCQPIALGINTDAYQPVERKQGITREILQTLQQYRHPVSIVTKSSLIERDIDILEEMAQDNLIHVAISITTLDKEMARTMEPRASAPQRRLQTVSALKSAGIPVSVFVAPLVPVLTDAELETIMTQAHHYGADDCAYILLRLPHELKELFYDWLDTHHPLKANHVRKRLQDSRGGKDYDSQFGQRMIGSGVFADLIRQRFHKKHKQLRFSGTPPLNTRLFRSPNRQEQFNLF